MDFFKDTPLSKAVFELLSQLNAEIEQKIPDINQAGSIKAYIFGGCAIHMYTNTRGSNDLDVEFEAAQKLKLRDFVVDLEDVYYNDPEEGDVLLVLDDTFNIGITPVMSPDYKIRAIPIITGDQVLHVYLVHPLDIAISKLSRCQADDVEDIIALYQREKFTLVEFKEESKISLDHSATPNSLCLNIEHVIMRLESL